ncbi:MAG: hypothetical protein FWG64_08595 [Firmicutes bacterium]|nr:hypothetical protein [Bacillota bacterium]
MRSMKAKQVVAAVLVAIMLLTNISFNNQTEVFAYESDLSPPQWQTYDTAYTGGRA